MEHLFHAFCAISAAHVEVRFHDDEKGTERPPVDNDGRTANKALEHRTVVSIVIVWLSNLLTYLDLVYLTKDPVCFGW